MFFLKSKQRKHWDKMALKLYAVMVEQARLPVFYTQHGVPDTLDGRFDCLSLHMSLLVRRLGKTDLSQALVDLMFADMDMNLRESGVSDISLGRKVRKLAEAFYGRLNAYAQALDAQDRSAMTQAILRNLYRKEDHPSASAITDYAFGVAAQLAAIPDSNLEDGVLSLEQPH